MKIYRVQFVNNKKKVSLIIYQIHNLIIKTSITAHAFFFVLRMYNLQYGIYYLKRGKMNFMQ